MKNLSSFFGILAILFYSVMFAAMFSNDLSIKILIASLLLGIFCTCLFLYLGKKAEDQETLYTYDKRDAAETAY